MTPPWRVAAAVAVLGFGAACPPRALAQAITVDPVNLHMSGTGRATLVRITNPDARPVQVQLRAFAWSQGVRGPDTLADADEVVIGPPFATIAPGATQVIRVLLRASSAARTLAPNRERAYRVMVYRLPSPGAKATLEMRLTLSLPLFIDPAKAVPAAAPTWRIDGTPAHRELVVVNQGAIHLRVDTLALAIPGRPPLTVPGNGSPYVLAGAERRWTIPAGAVLPTNTAISLTTASGGRSTTFLVPAPAA